MRRSLAAVTALAVVAPTAAFAQDVIVRERTEPQVIVREPSERVIVREPSERVVVQPAPTERVVVQPAPEVVRRYVVREARPSVRVERRIVVGDTLPESVEAYSVPDSEYSYTVVNDHRYLVNRERRIVEVMD